MKTGFSVLGLLTFALSCCCYSMTIISHMRHKHTVTTSRKYRLGSLYSEYCSKLNPSLPSTSLDSSYPLGHCCRCLLSLSSQVDHTKSFRTLCIYVYVLMLLLYTPIILLGLGTTNMLEYVLHSQYNTFD